ncbi:glutathione S-transferase [Metarhizium robertsii]|uniref:glutathione transferase n=2 Tax=Metarhizium robertsii TaxID=568076 RepID=E9F8C7_METRA|nr:Glutathione S-transferase/chloride channel [Metarhizium robertsii ARSEF 23]EFY96034.1 Glutathione S-transferase/chloride channel [Metarhizium robertsii ARSEF 23]EXU99199.1 glutathione S-transferase [Metarhizium robertsii]
MSGLKPLTLWIHAQGPNPKKVLIVLEELGVPYESITIHKPKDASFLAINPNGRLPAIQDPNNNDLILWESGAIVEYVVETYDKENKLTFASNPEKWFLKQFLHFQMSGQGPYFGQASWFRVYHPEDVPSAKKRYADETVRVIDVLNTILEGKKYLVGEKFTYADLVFIPWDEVVRVYIKDIWEGYEIEQKYPNFLAWHNRLMERRSVKKAYGA